MITFLRKFRILVSQTYSVSKYLSYAIGEILLVVIGILIALQVNNWNENRKNHDIEQKLLMGLLQEFEANLAAVDSTMSRNDANISQALKLGEFTGPTVIKADEKYLSDLMVGAFSGVPSYTAQMGNLTEIINSGRLSVLSDAALRAAISSWQAEIERIKDQESFVRQRSMLSQNFFMHSGNFRRHLEVVQTDLINTTPSRFPPNQFAFLQNQEFESQLYLFIVASRNLSLNFYIPFKRKIETVCAMIKRDLKA